MSRTVRLVLIVALVGSSVACGGDAPGGGGGAVPDGGGGPDAAAEAPDAAAGAPDAGAVPLAGFGAITGTCGTIDAADLTSSEPQLIANEITFEVGLDESNVDQLTPGGQLMLAAGNAGGSSLESEVIAFEVLARCELAALLETETEISYDVEGTITDLLVELDGHKVGVSVVRAVRFPFDSPYEVDDARPILEGKLADILESSANVSAEDAWTKQILSVIAYGPMHAASVASAWEVIDPALRADTIVVVTVSSGDDAFLY